MQRSANNSDFSVPLFEHDSSKQWKFTFSNDRSTQSARPTVFPRAKVLTKLQSLPFESMRRNFHVKLPHITIDKISAIAFGPYGRNSEVTTASHFNVRHQNRDICIHVSRCLPVRFVIPMQNLSRLLYPEFHKLAKTIHNENNLISSSLIFHSRIMSSEISRFRRSTAICTYNTRIFNVLSLFCFLWKQSYYTKWNVWRWQKQSIKI